MKSRAVLGDWNSICDICGFEYKRSEMKLTWNNLLVCQTDFEPKHPQLTIRPVRDNFSVRSTRTEQPDPPLQDPPITESQMV